MSRRNRPTAFEVSFPEEAKEGPSRPGGLLAGHGAPKRKSPSADTINSEGKRQKIAQLAQDSRSAALPPPEVCYVPQPRDIKERKDFVVLGEDTDDEYEGTESKPIRVLSDFCIFDPKHGLQVVSLDLLDAGDYVGHFEAAGFVSPLFLNEEDAGQEDGIDDDEPASSLQRLRTSAVFRYTIDYAKVDDPVYIETQFGWYVLQEPSAVYRHSFLDFYERHRLLQIIISAAAENPLWTYQDFTDCYIGMHDQYLNRRLDETDIYSIIPQLRPALEDCEGGAELTAVPMIQHLFRGQKLAFTKHLDRAHAHPVTRHDLVGNIDLDVLRPEKQNRTHVTPLIDQLAAGFFQEHLEVVGPPPKVPSKHVLRQREHQARLQLFQLMEKTMQEKSKPIFHRSQRLHDEYWHAVSVNGEDYYVGEVIVTVAGAYHQRAEAELPDDLESLPDTATIADFFWFAQIVYINQKRKQLHVQWFEHSSQTFLQEISDPQELFAFNSCSDIDIDLVVGKVDVHWCIPRSTELPATEFYCNLLYDDNNASFTTVNQPNTAHTKNMLPPHNCSVCLLSAQQMEDQSWRKINDGIVHLGITYHIEDYVLVKTEDGPADIGQILDMHFSTTARQYESATITLRLLGRISNIIDLCPSDVMKDEHHLFLTDEKVTIPVELLLRRCSILHFDAIKDLSMWLSISPFHFFVRYHFVSPRPRKWVENTLLTFNDVHLCKECYKEDKKQMNIRKKFFIAARQKPLKAFDPFGGVGAFGLGMEEAGCLKMVHAVEISPSAAETLK
ncbi:hypothetical protein SCP_1202590 [Sparassis crispa]|uniref:BAH domain-containing protein n=1 Tax=Sparassis crispa TaxID=139825 RepID=A0A401H0S7_9APHY|nr:hypothetical protein SCP_1202590 [Sparassis crispa]GBE88031.1 hypothetical protein SCP_1202590 [Sparassis crispa]